MLTARSLFEYRTFAHASLFSGEEPVWTALQRLRAYMDTYSYPAVLPAAITGGIPVAQPLVLHGNRTLPAVSLDIEWGDVNKGRLRISENGHLLEGASLIMAGAILCGERIALGPGSLVEGGATIKAPTIIGAYTEVRQGAYLRGYCLVGDRCVVGHATEMKHSIFLDDAKAGHFAYLGDSILGNDTNLGAGTKFANLKFAAETVKIAYDGELIDTGMRKFGAILGDGAQTGCNSVTNPGTIIGRRGILMPNTTAPSGYHEDDKLIRIGVRPRTLPRPNASDDAAKGEAD